MREVLLYSGGMDSFIAWHYLGKPKTVFVRLGHKYQKKEFDSVFATIPDTFVTKVFPYGIFEGEDATIPARNLFLAMIGAQYGNRIWLVVQKDETSIPDRTPKFFTDGSEILSTLLERKIELASPFWDLDKTDMVKWYLDHVGDVGSLLDTVGCYGVGGRFQHCGDCSACFRRYVALANNGIDPGYTLSERIKGEYRGKMDHYSEERQARMARWVA